MKQEIIKAITVKLESNYDEQGEEQEAFVTEKASFSSDQIMPMTKLDVSVLCAAVKGEIDLNQVAAIILSRLGLDENGNYIGNDEAAEKFIGYDRE